MPSLDNGRSDATRVDAAESTAGTIDDVSPLLPRRTKPIPIAHRPPPLTTHKRTQKHT